jgi:TolB-like protein
MSSDDAAAAATPRPTVFLSYAAQDRPAARALQDALSQYGLEAWLDESELGGGEAWDQKIRRQIRECQYFIPLVSAQTEARLEGYFRREWRFAVERTLDMADGTLFLLPIAIDGTDQATARVPEKFLEVQWLKVPEGRPTPALEALCRRIAAGQVAPEPARRGAPSARRKAIAKAYTQIPAFPVRAPDQKLPYWMAVAAWAGQASWASFLRLPRWIRLVAYVWLGIGLLAHYGGDRSDAEDVSPANIEKIKAIAQQYQGNANKADIARLGEQIAREFAGGTSVAGTGAQKAPLLAIPFAAPGGDAAAARLADSAFAMIYGRLALSRHGHVALSEQALPSADTGAALERARAQQSSYVLFGTIANPGASAVLDVRIATVADNSILWAKSYPIAGADAAAIAAEVDAKVPALED